MFQNRRTLQILKQNDAWRLNMRLRAFLCAQIPSDLMLQRGARVSLRVRVRVRMSCVCFVYVCASCEPVCLCVCAGALNDDGDLTDLGATMADVSALLPFPAFAPAPAPTLALYVHAHATPTPKPCRRPHTFLQPCTHTA